MTFNLLPPKDGCCRICAIAHDDDQPHDATTFYYRFLFKNTHGRDATWSDAMLHCSQEVKDAWTSYLNSIGVDVNSTDVFGGITSKEQLEARLKEVDHES
jgi:hypothetical protein